MCGNGIYTCRGAVRISAGRVCAGTGIHIYHGTAGFRAGFDCCVAHLTPSRTSHKNRDPIPFAVGARGELQLSASELQTFD